MEQSANVVIIGGGCIGTSIALNLAKKMDNIILIEKGGIASGATGMSSALIRTRYWNEVTARIAIKAWHVFSDFPNKIGGESGFTRRGVMWLVGEDRLKDMEKNVQLLRNLGGAVLMLTPDQIVKIEPLLSLAGIAGAAWEPNSGYADPTLTTHSYAKHAKALGVEFQLFTEVKSIHHSGGRISSVETTHGSVKTSKVVNATGLWSQSVGAMVGVPLPIQPARAHVGLFKRPEGLGDNSPVISDFVGMDYYRPFGKGITLVGSSYHDGSKVDLANIDTSPSWQAVEQMAQKFSWRFPKLAETKYQSGYAYAYDNTPDFHPILDEITTSGVEGFYCAVGFSGHGFKEAPIVGEMMADFIASGSKKGSDIDFFRYSRFEENKLIYSPFPGG